ncbi:MAG: GGDEF domain-containing protein [Gammaproteobacteria bacterium]|nr:GGDEF domain-containing protein [Gammaproteobacteria bacterium]
MQLSRDLGGWANERHLRDGGPERLPPPSVATGDGPESQEVMRALASCRREVEDGYRQIELLRKATTFLQWAVTVQQQKDAQARALAHHDSLTGLPNRRLLHDRLHQATAQSTRQRKKLALLLLDLDDFKHVNGKFGRAVGDKILQTMAERLATSIRDADTVCRYGGDEFVIMLPELDDPQIATRVVDKIQKTLSEPCVIDGFEIRITASVGTVIFPDEGESCAELMDMADIALYHAKTVSGKSSITLLAQDSDADQPPTVRAMSR